MSNATLKQEMPSEQAEWLFMEGATLVFLDVPAGTEFGVDYNSWTVGVQFKGVKMIPLGVHFVYYSAVGRDRQVAPRTGFMHNFTAQEVLVKKWDKQAEDIMEGDVTAEEQGRIEDNKHELDRYLGVYPYESYKKWISLTNHMTWDLMLRLQPLCVKISAVTPLQSVGSTTQSRRDDLARSAVRDPIELSSRRSSEVPSDDHLLPDMKPFPGTEMRFTSIPRRKYPDSASAGDVTRYSMDHSYVLSTLLAKDVYAGNPLSLLGEMQFAFVSFLLGQVFEGFEQWKLIVDLLCSCVEAIAVSPELYTHFISTLHHHIQEIPEDFFVDIVTCENFLTRSLRKFFENLESVESSSAREQTLIAALKKRGLRFREHLEHRFRWDFGSDLDEYAPVVVL